MKNKNTIIRIISFLSFFCIKNLDSYAQREADHWTFSRNHLNFGGGNLPQSSPLLHGYGSVSAGTMSDKNGNLLFYTDGHSVRNRNYEYMPAMYSPAGGNDFLFGPGVFNRQGVIITPWPGNDSLYYIFYIYDLPSDLANTVLYYAVVNMNADGGLGDVIVKEQLLLGGQNVNYKMSAVLHCNKKDIWLVGHLRNSDKYFSLPITSSGVIDVPVYSTCNLIPEANLADHSLHGSLKISALGNKLAAAHQGLDFTELCDFNNQTGVVSNPKKISIRPGYAIPPPVPFNISTYGPTCTDFSASGEKLYIAGAYETFWPPYGGTRHVNRVCQFDATQPTEAAIQATKFNLDSFIVGEFGAMQIANNGKLYITRGTVGLSCINNPEVAGLGCNFNLVDVISLVPSAGNMDLPSFMQSYFRYPIIATGNCQFKNISFNIQNAIGVSSIFWNFGDPASGINNFSSSFTPTHIYSTEGVYTVKAVLQNSNGCGADTITKVVHAGPFAVYLGNDTAFCQGDTLKLKMKVPNGSNYWSNGSFDSVINVTQPGTYWVRVSLGECTASDTIIITKNNLPQFTLGNDTLICSNQPLIVTPNPNYPSANYLWSNNATTSAITVSTAGNHWLRLTDMYGCRWRDTINVNFKQLPNYSLGNDTAICTKDTLQLNATVNGATNYVWNTGAIAPTIKTYLTDIYWCDVNKDGCVYRDSIAVLVKPLPIVNLGKDTTLCEDNTLLLNVTNPPTSNYLWQDGKTTPTYLVTQNGQYNARVIMNGCVNRDTINVDYFLKPHFTLGPNQPICSGMILLLDPNINNVNYLWQDGSTNKTYAVTQPGLYRLTASNYCGSTSDDVLITTGACKLYIPNAFTPNGDGKNDIFRASYGENVTEYQMQVFNRYGQIIFTSKEINKGWDGTYSGKKQPLGSYAWVIKYKTVTTANTEVLKGTVLLIK